MGNSTQNTNDDAMSQELIANLIEFCENRGRVYGLLSRCFETEIDAAFAQEFATSARLDSEVEGLAQKFANLQADLAKCIADTATDATADAAATSGESPTNSEAPSSSEAFTNSESSCNGATLEQLAVVFDRVFFGMGPRTAQKAFPYESVYTSPGGLLMQEAYSQVTRLYREKNFQKNPSFTEPEDHVAVELAFMAQLCACAVEALRVCDEAAAEQILRDQLSFAREHLLNWIDRFGRDLRKAAEQGFYADLADFTVAYVQADEVALSEVVE